MPASLEAAIVIAVLIVPGLTLISGYRRARAHTVPSRDLYVLAQAVAVSLAWLPVIWVLGGRVVLDWIDREVLAEHQLPLLGIVLGNLALALLIGLLVGHSVAWLSENPRHWVSKALKWTGIFEPPTAWDAAWLEADRGLWAAVEIDLRSGDTIGVLFDDGSTVGLSPAPRDLFFDTGYRYDSNGDVEAEEHKGIYIDGSEVVSFRVVHIEPEQ